MNKKFQFLRKSFPKSQKLQDGKNMQSSNAIAKTDTLGDQSDTPTSKNTEQSSTVSLADGVKFVNNIARFPLLDFIDCCVHHKYDSLLILGEAKEEEFGEKWIVLLSQYYKARGDEENNEKNEIIFKMQELRLRAAIITMLLNSVGMIYSTTLINALRSFDEAFEQFSFSEDTINEDLQLIKNMEMSNDLQYSMLKEELEAMESVKGIKSVNGEQVFYDWVASYNETFKTSFSVEGLSTLTYANNCKRLDKYASDLEMDKIQS